MAMTAWKENSGQKNIGPGQLVEPLFSVSTTQLKI